MKSRWMAGMALGSMLQAPLLAAQTVAPVAATSPTLSLLKTILGLAVVLAVMAAIAWAFKRFSPGKLGGPSALRIVGGVSVGSREKVVVVEVADRWLVLGVAPGQVTSLANLDIVRNSPADQPESGTPVAPNLATTGQAFAGWLRKALEKR